MGVLEDGLAYLKANRTKDRNKMADILVRLGPEALLVITAHKQMTENKPKSNPMRAFVAAAVEVASSAEGLSDAMDAARAVGVDPNAARPELNEQLTVVSDLLQIALSEIDKIKAGGIQ